MPNSFDQYRNSSLSFVNKAWNGLPVAGQYGGTGVANTGKTLTLGGNVTFSGAFAVQFTMPGAFTYTFPGATGTLADLASTQTFTNKTLTSPTLNTPTLNSPTMVTPVLGTPTSGNLTNCTFPTLNQNTSGYAEALKSATTTVSVSAAAAPTALQVLQATSATTATWQDKLVGDHKIIVHTGNGYGSTNTRCRRYTTTLSSVGTDISYTNSTTAGATFTINTTGLYAITVGDGASTAGTAMFGASVNTSQGATALESINVAARVVSGFTPASLPSSGATASCVAYFTAGDEIRPHIGGVAAVNSTSNLAFFSIRRVG